MPVSAKASASSKAESTGPSQGFSANARITGWVFLATEIVQPPRSQNAARSCVRSRVANHDEGAVVAPLEFRDGAVRVLIDYIIT